MNCCGCPDVMAGAPDVFHLLLPWGWLGIIATWQLSRWIWAVCHQLSSLKSLTHLKYTRVQEAWQFRSLLLWQGVPGRLIPAINLVYRWPFGKNTLGRCALPWMQIWRRAGSLMCLQSKLIGCFNWRECSPSDLKALIVHIVDNNQEKVGLFKLHSCFNKYKRSLQAQKPPNWWYYV